MYLKKFHLSCTAMLAALTCWSGSVAEVTLVSKQSADLVEWTAMSTNIFIAVIESNAYYSIRECVVTVFNPQVEAVAGADAFIADPEPQPVSISVWNSRGDPSLDAENPGKYRNVILVAPDMFVMTKHYRLEVGDFVLWQDGDDTFLREVVDTKFHPTLDIGLGWLDKPVPVEPETPCNPAFINRQASNGYVWQLYPVIGFDCNGDWCVHELIYYSQLRRPNQVYTEYLDSHLSGESGRPVFLYMRGERYLLGIFVSINTTLVAVTDGIIDQIIGE